REIVRAAVAAARAARHLEERRGVLHDHPTDVAAEAGAVLRAFLDGEREAREGGHLGEQPRRLVLPAAPFDDVLRQPFSSVAADHGGSTLRPSRPSARPRGSHWVAHGYAAFAPPATGWPSTAVGR